MIVTKEQVEQAFNAGGFTINERFKECGYIYFPNGKDLKGKKGRDYPDQGRVFFSFEEHEYPDTPEGAFEKQMDTVMGGSRDTVSVSPSWGRPNDRQTEQIHALLKVWVTYTRQARGEWNYSLADRTQMAEEAELAQEVEA